MIEYVDCVLDMAYGDSGKGKITHQLLKDGKYTHCLRFSGGSNAGHTIYHNGKKFVTHLIPAGVFFGVKSVIGPGCVLNFDKFISEINYLENNGLKVRDLIKVATNTQIVTQEHLIEDSTDTKIGTTRQGIGPAYRDKYDRCGLQAKNVPGLKSFLIDMYEEFYSNESCRVLAEGAQGFYLDVDWGEYPYVTSSHCGVGSVLLNGFSSKQIRNVYGVAKCYETYVGTKKFQPDNPIFDKVRELGAEYGATTGRPRQCRWLNWNELKKAVDMNGITHLIINKMDVLEQLAVWNVSVDNHYEVFRNRKEFETEINTKFQDHPTLQYVIFSGSPESI